MKKQDLKEILSHILKCGYRDIDFILDLLVRFNVDYSDIEWNCKFANEIIEDIYFRAIRKANIDQEKHDINLYINYHDSRLPIDGEDLYSFEDLISIRDKDKNN